MLLSNSFPTIVTLHYVSDDKKYNDLKPWAITRASFIRLLDFLETNNYQTIVFEDLKQGVNPDKSIILTFDDCPKDLWEFAIPELAKRNMKAVFYIPTAQLGGYNSWNVVFGKPRIALMDKTDIQKLTAIGMEIGSHAHDHIMLEHETQAKVTWQLSKSRSILEALTNKPVLSVAFPFGSLPKQVQYITQATVYEYGLGVFVRWQSRYAIRRWIYDDTDNEQTLIWKCSRQYRMYRAYADRRQHYYRQLQWKLYQAYASVKSRLTNR